MKNVKENYKHGLCPDQEDFWPTKCNCGAILRTKADCNSEPCEDEWCEVCQYCGTLKCPDCGEHLHCGGCV